MPKGLKEASKAAKVRQLNSIGVSKGEFIIENDLEPVEIALGEFIKRVQKNLKSEDMIVSDKIGDIVIQKKDNSVIEVLANPELIYQDKGVNGSEIKLYDTPYSYKDKRPPVQPFIDWIKKKNMTLRHNEVYHGKASGFKKVTKEDEIKSVAYAIREKVFQDGFKPRNIYSKEIPKLIEDLEDGLTDFVVQEILRKL